MMHAGLLIPAWHLLLQAFLQDLLQTVLQTFLQVDYDEDKLCADAAGVLAAAAVDYQQYSQLLLQADSDPSALSTAKAG